MHLGFFSGAKTCLSLPAHVECCNSPRRDFSKIYLVLLGIFLLLQLLNQIRSFPIVHVNLGMVCARLFYRDSPIDNFGRFFAAILTLCHQPYFSQYISECRNRTFCLHGVGHAATVHRLLTVHYPCRNNLRARVQTLPAIFTLLDDGTKGGGAPW